MSFSEHDYSKFGEFASHMEAVERNIGSLSDTDVEMLLLKAPDTMLFREVFSRWVRAYATEIGSDPQFDLVFHIDDLGTDDERKKGMLKFLKSMREDRMYQMYVKSITVKGTDRDAVVALEPNVFASDVKFKSLED